MHFISDGRAGLSNGIEKVDARHPLLCSQLDFSSKVMDVFDQGAEDKSVSRSAIGPNGVDNMLGEVGVNSVGDGGRGGHCDGCWKVVLMVRGLKDWMIGEGFARWMDGDDERKEVAGE